MSPQQETHDQQAKEFWNFARHVSKEVEEWPTWKRNTLVSFSTSTGRSMSDEDLRMAKKSVGKTIRVGRDARTGQFVSVKEAKRRKSTTVVETIKKKKK